MHDAGDTELLRDYAQQGSEDAFAELVQRHVNLVYSTARRHVTVVAHAEEITQTVFVALARKAVSLRADTILDAWLYETTRLTALRYLRGERRRQSREQEAYMQSTQPESAEIWNQLAPLLDEAMAGLDQRDREAVVLRFFREKSLGEVAAAMQIKETAAQSRVYRAVEKLRAFFTKRGVTLSAAGLTTAIGANSVQSAPIGLAATVTAAALSGTALTTSAVIAATKTIAMTTLQKTLVTVTVAVLAGAGIYEARHAAQLREQNQMLQQAQAPLADQIQQLQNERDSATNTVSWLKQELAKNEGNNAELLKLRGEVGVVRNQLADAKRANGPVEQPRLATGQAYLKRSYEHGAKREFEAELDDLNHAIELDPTLAQAYRERAGLYSRLPEDRGGEKKAVADYSRHLELKPNDVGSLLMRADAYEKLGEFDKSIADYTTVIQSIGQNTADFSNVYRGNNTDRSYWIASAYTMRAQIYKVDKHDYSSAIADYTATIQLNPISPSAYRSRGECYEAIGERSKAQQDFAIEPKRN